MESNWRLITSNITEYVTQCDVETYQFVSPFKVFVIYYTLRRINIIQLPNKIHTTCLHKYCIIQLKSFSGIIKFDGSKNWFFCCYFMTNMFCRFHARRTFSFSISVDYLQSFLCCSSFSRCHLYLQSLTFPATSYVAFKDL